MAKEVADLRCKIIEIRARATLRDYTVRSKSNM